MNSLYQEQFTRVSGEGRVCRVCEQTSERSAADSAVICHYEILHTYSGFFRRTNTERVIGKQCADGLFLLLNMKSLHLGSRDVVGSNSIQENVYLKKKEEEEEGEEALYI